MKRNFDEIRIIALFMGFTRDETEKVFERYITPQHLKDFSFHKVDLGFMEFDTNYAWIMPIIEQIQNDHHRIEIHEDGYVQLWSYDRDGYCDEPMEFHSNLKLSLYNAAVAHIRYQQKIADEFDGKETAEQLMSWDEKKDALSRKFSSILMKWLGKETMEDVVRVNTERGDNTCASHDHCDANMAMLEAFEVTFGRANDLQDDDDTSLWNVSWDIAKKHGFYINEDGKA